MFPTTNTESSGIFHDLAKKCRGSSLAVGSCNSQHIVPYLYGKPVPLLPIQEAPAHKELLTIGISVGTPGLKTTRSRLSCTSLGSSPA